MMMEHTAEQATLQYAKAYQKLYNRPPDARPLDSEWVIVNGARMRAGDLHFLAQQLHAEYERSIAQKRSVVQKLLKWFKQ